MGVNGTYLRPILQEVLKLSVHKVSLKKKSYDYFHISQCQWVNMDNNKGYMSSSLNR